MTVAEAKAVFGLREEDTITEDGLDRLRGCVASLQKQTVSRRSKQECQRQIEALDVLKRHYFGR